MLRLRGVGGTYSNHVFWGLELPESNINSHTTLALSFQLIQDLGYSRIWWYQRDQERWGAIETHRT